MTTNLDFSFLDDFALARERQGDRALSFIRGVQAGRIGPALELCMLDRLSSSCSAAAVMSANATSELLNSQIDASGAFHKTSTLSIGAISTSRDLHDTHAIEWIRFCRKAQDAAEEASVPKALAQGLVGAMREMEENIHLHSGSAVDGRVAFRSTAKEFEFVVADSGRGVLSGLRELERYSHITDAGTALRTALADGESRLLDQNAGRGFGFHDLFVSLATLSCSLRFRSDDHALTINGIGAALPKAQIRQKAMLKGFVISVVCRTTPQAQS